MTKTLELPLQVYEELIKTVEELSLMSKKPISPAMAVELLIEVYRAHMSDPCALDKFSQQLQIANLMTPEEFEQYWDEDKHGQTSHNVRPKGKQANK
ncbi:MAG: hypothetical protein ACQCN5_12210 [Candidatus Bathyarchaeia archaeon]|jgi:hypothetical protein